MKSVIAIALVVALAGCASGSNFSMDAAGQIKPGMSKAEVVAMLGEPNQKLMTNGNEVWTWARVNVFKGESQAASVMFVNGVVHTPSTASTKY